MLYDIDGSGEREYTMSAYTMVIYEQEFGGASLISDVYGKIRTAGKDESGVYIVPGDYVKERLSSALPEGKELPKTTAQLVDKAFPAAMVTELDYTADNWEAYLRAMWAMARTADAARNAKDTPAYAKWAASLGPVNMADISRVVFEQVQGGLFRTIPAGRGGEGEPAEG